MVFQNDVELRLGDLLPLRPAHATNADMRGRVGDEHSRFYNGCTQGNVEHKCASYKPSDAVRKLRERMRRDLPVFTKSTKAKRVTNRMQGRRPSPMAYERYRHGAMVEPRFWEDRVRQEKPKTGNVKIAVNIGLRGNESSKNLEWSGAVALALADALEEMGYRVSLYAVQSSEGHSFGTYHAAIEVKGPQDRLSDQATALISEGGIKRVIWFSHLTTLERRVGVSFGSSCEYAGTKVKADVTVPYTLTSEQQAYAFVAETMAELAKRGENS